MLAISEPAALIVVALVSLCATFVTAVFAYLGQKRGREVKEEVSTNNGKRAFEYLEMLSELREGQADLHVGQARLEAHLTEHTNQDAENFAALQQRLNRIGG